MAYIGTSVLVAYYCPEPLSELAEKSVREVDSPAISPLTEVEFCSAMAIKVRIGDMDEGAAERVISTFRMHLEEKRYCICPIETEHYILSADWVGRFSTALRSLDALHLAVAFVEDKRLITADGVLAESANHFGIKNTLLQ